MGNGSAEASGFSRLPETLLLRILGGLGLADLASAAAVSRQWNRVSKDEAIWRRRLIADFEVETEFALLQREVDEAPASWRCEYRRLRWAAPTEHTETLGVHRDEVLHIAFSHDGAMLASSSKDCTVKLFQCWAEESGTVRPLEFLMEQDMRAMLHWNYTQCSLFNEDDDLLLVSGVHLGDETIGEIVIFEIDLKSPLPCLKFRARVLNKPYDIFGCWYNRGHVLNGELHWLGHMNSTSHLWLCKASQDAHTERTAVLAPLFKFLNHNGSNLRMISVTSGVSGRVRAAILASRRLYTEEETRLAEEGSAKRPKTERGRADETFAKIFSPEYRGRVRVKSPAELIAEGAFDDVSGEGAAGGPSTSHRRCDNCRLNHDAGGDERGNCSVNAYGEEIHEVCTCLCHGTVNDRLLVFSTGATTYTSHQIGLKLIPGDDVLRRMNAEVVPPERFDRIRECMKTMREATEAAARGEEAEEAPEEEEPAPDNWAAVERDFDRPDHLIEMHGHVVGLTLSSDHKFLFANVRPWLNVSEDSVIDAWNPPPISEDTELRVVDLATLSVVPGAYVGHKGFTPNNACFFIFADGCRDFLASGSEDGRGQLWSRRFHAPLGTLAHASVVNSVAFSPTDPELLVTASDDFSIKVWRSRRVCRLMETRGSLPLLTDAVPDKDQRLHAWDLPGHERPNISTTV